MLGTRVASRGLGFVLEHRKPLRRGLTGRSEGACREGWGQGQEADGPGGYLDQRWGDGKDGRRSSGVKMYFVLDRLRIIWLKQVY